MGDTTATLTGDSRSFVHATRRPLPGRAEAIYQMCQTDRTMTPRLLSISAMPSLT